MPLDFPTSPANNDTYTFDNKTWRFTTGKGWKLVPNQIQGIQGTQGTSVQGQAGSAQGSSGSQGLQGLQGVQGLSNQGTQGVQGLQGVQGIQGLQGVQGVQGLQGTQGVQGLQGTQGVQGLSNQGTQGLQGLQGTFGPATVPLSTDTFGSGDTIVAADNGKLVSITGGLTIADVFTTGQNCVIYNDSTSQQTLTAASGLTLRLAGTAQTGTRYLQRNGLATVICVGITTYAISGAGVT